VPHRGANTEGPQIADARVTLIAWFVAFALPVWCVVAWSIGLLDFGEAKPLNAAQLRMVETTRGDLDDLLFCLTKNATNGLSFYRERTGAPDVFRFKNRIAAVASK
jgi:hypothetical protein